MFANSRKVPDAEWQARYQLAFAANLLGLPATRLHKGMHEVATLYLVKGTIALAEFLANELPGSPQ
jgi:hypothetical protein